MTDLERIAKLNVTAKRLGINLHLISTSFTDTASVDGMPELTPTDVVKVFGITTITSPVNDSMAFYMQQRRYDKDGSKDEGNTKA